MINYHKNLVSALKTILPTHYELNLHAGLATPCISYMEVNNYSQETGDTLGYTSLEYQVKVWGNKLEDLQNYALQIDNKLRPLGFTRVSCRELYDNESAMIQKIMLYEAKALENFD